ncbi:suppressor of tumorigenicity 14 -like protein, partial [Brachionus plicatilis]
PCLLKKCHKNASVCIDRFPFWAQCICDRGYAGNGRSHCVECGISYVQPNLERIVGGKDSLKSSWPFAVYIIQTYQGQYDIKGSSRLINFSWVCGGTILNQRIILTAAHCIQDKFFGYEDEQGNSYTLEIQWNQWYSNVESTLEVYAGVNDIRNINKSQRLPVKRVNKHEQFNEYTLLNDVAIIELNENIESRFDIQFACLPNSSSTVYPEVNRSAFIIGWGRTSENGYPSSVLQNSKIKIFQADKCSRIEVDVEKNWDSQICAGSLDGSRDTCQGDSGGGLFVTEFLEPNQSQYFVSGIVSYGDGCARVGKPGIFQI